MLVREEKEFEAFHFEDSLNFFTKNVCIYLSSFN